MDDIFDSLMEMLEKPDTDKPNKTVYVPRKTKRFANLDFLEQFVHRGRTMTKMSERHVTSDDGSNYFFSTEDMVEPTGFYSNGNPVHAMV